ncbi:MAG: phytanoyl-CoA dioxygenase family protein [Sphingomonas sp.]|uniref:phytanoyl-CoA dioxygenase family protein n=1 Tax=Sphingomonas sp. TaxID=28214 RepID=UPI003F81C9A2
MGDPDTRFEQIRGLRALWARATGRESPSDSRAIPVRPLLDTLGLGLEQVISLLGRERPDWPDFTRWIAATAGTPDATRLARYQAWYDGAPAPAAEVARQAAVMAMPPVFDASDLAAWDRDGVVVLRNAVTRDEAAAIADHLWSLLEAHPGDPASWYGPRTNGIMIQHFQHPAMDVPRRSIRIARAFAELYGHADLIASTDRLSFNPPEHGRYIFPGPHLHWDANLTPPMAFEAQAILYLTDTAADQGALQVVPGFHHRLAAGWIESLCGADPRGIDLSAEAVTVPAGAGDLVIWRHELPHGASANRSDRPRLAQYVTHYPMHWPDERPWL